MSFGVFYKVEDKMRSYFEGCITKSDWYEALDGVNIQNYESCDAEESIPAWALALKNEGSPVCMLFQGEMRAQENEFDDPDVVFVNKEMVNSVVNEIERKSKSHYKALLDDIDCSADFWLFDSMFEFLKDAALNNKAIVVVWGK